MELPLIDVGPLVRRDEAVSHVAEMIDEACRAHGFFLVTGHGVSDALLADLDRSARAFFALDEARKSEVAMASSGPAWRGWFPVGGELTSGEPDHKEGYYFGTELAGSHPRVRSRTPLHGANPFPTEVPMLRESVLAYLDEMRKLADALMSGIALGLGLGADHFARHITADPTMLFRIFHYPPQPEPSARSWGVAEHTDYGLLTILLQDSSGGLEVHTPSGWVDATPVEGAFVCNLGDMLERMTAGRYVSTPHRVRPPVGDEAIGRLSFPFFFDPGWDVNVEPLDLALADHTPRRRRWDGEDPLAFDGTYGDYLTAKVARVFPALFADTVES